MDVDALPEDAFEVDDTMLDNFLRGLEGGRALVVLQRRCMCLVGTTYACHRSHRRTCRFGCYSAAHSGAVVACADLGHTVLIFAFA